MITEAGTNKCDFARLTAPITLAAYDAAMEADPDTRVSSRYCWPSRLAPPP